MNSPAHSFALWLASQGEGEFAGDNAWAISVGSEPESPSDCVTLYDTGGGEADTDEMDILYPEFQVRVRSKSYPDGFNKSSSIRSRLLRMAITELDGVRYARVNLTSDVAMIGKDDNDRFLFVANYMTMLSN